MLKEQRLNQIRNMIRQNGEVETGSLCRIYGVTEMTIRRDLDLLSAEESIVRTRGGAMLADRQLLIETSFDRRIAVNKDSKTAIAKKALELIKDGQTVYIDSGTTGYMLAQLLPGHLHLVVLTNAINIAAEILSRTHVTVVMIGGELQPGTLSCRGAVAEDTLNRFHVDIAFIGTNAVGRNGDLYIGSVTETGYKKTVIATAEKKYVMADSSKIGKLSLCRFASAKDIDGIITDDGIGSALAEELKGHGANLMIAPVSHKKKTK